MKIEYNEIEKSLKIKDGLKFNCLALNFILVLNILSALINLSILNEKQFNWFGFIWVILGLASIIILIYKYLKLSTSEKIELNQIVALKEKNLLGRKSFSLKLKNGKTRALNELKTQSEIKEMKQLFDQIGIKYN